MGRVEPHSREHRFDEGYMHGLAVVGCCGYSELQRPKGGSLLL